METTIAPLHLVIFLVICYTIVFRELIIEVLMLIVWVSFVSFLIVQELFISKWCSSYRSVLLVVYCHFLFALCLFEDMEVFKCLLSVSSSFTACHL